MIFYFIFSISSSFLINWGSNSLMVQSFSEIFRKLIDKSNVTEVMLCNDVGKHR